MIPRLKAVIGAREIAALLAPGAGAVEQFEAAFARQFDAAHALAFPYGRSALWAFLEAEGLRDAEVIVPAYTCVVVAHAVVLSGNHPRFVDSEPGGYNMDLDEVARAIGPRTRAVIATHLFGYPADVEAVRSIVVDAERRYGQRIWVVQDCAHAFGARWRGRLVSGAGDLALFGLNISKMMTSVFGGMITTDDDALADRMRRFRDERFAAASHADSLRHRAYLLAVGAAFSRPVYGLVYRLAHATALLDRWTKAYHLDDTIHLPPDAKRQMTTVGARVGIAQLARYPAIVQARVAAAARYDELLRRLTPWTPAPLVDGATYSHYVCQVDDRDLIVARAAAAGVELGTLIDYSVPSMSAYRQCREGRSFPVAEAASQRTINLPIHWGLSPRAQERVVNAIRP